MNIKYNPLVLDMLNGQQHVSRALLIATLGGFRIAFTTGGSNDPGLRITVADLENYLKSEVLPNIEPQPGFMITIQDPHMVVELAQPTLDIILRQDYPVTANLIKDINSYRSKFVRMDLPLSRFAHQLLRTSYERLTLSVAKTFKIIRVASFIESLDAIDLPVEISAQAIAEAINYMSYRDEDTFL